MAALTAEAPDRSSARPSSDIDHPEGYHRPRRTSSAASSMFSFVSSNGNKYEDRIIVYDPLERKLWVDTKDNVKNLPNYIVVPIKGSDLKIPVYMEMGPANPNAKVLIATVDLSRLGKWVKGQRKKRRMQHIWVLGQGPLGLGPVKEEEPSN